MIPSVLVLLALFAFTDTGLGRGVRRAGQGLWHRATRHHTQDNDDTNDTGTGTGTGTDAAGWGQAPDAGGVPRRRWALPFWRRRGLVGGFGNVKAQVSGQGTPREAPVGGSERSPWGAR